MLGDGTVEAVFDGQHRTIGLAGENGFHYLGREAAGYDLGGGTKKFTRRNMAV